MLWLMMMAQALPLAVPTECAMRAERSGPVPRAASPVAVGVAHALVTVPLVMPPSTLPHGPVPVVRQAGWIRASDYPPVALMKHEQGSTGFVLSVNSRGEVSDCAVMVSSGSPTLDHVACGLLWQRAAFTPALDGQGRPVAGIYISRVNWILLGVARPPLPVRVPQPGKPCPAPVGQAQGPGSCGSIAPSAAMKGPLPTPASPPVPLNKSQWVTPEDYPSQALRKGEGGTVGFRLIVDTDGRVEACTVTASSGSDELDAAACSYLSRRAIFTPARDAAGRPVRGAYASHMAWTVPKN